MTMMPLLVSGGDSDDNGDDSVDWLMKRMTITNDDNDIAAVINDDDGGVDDVDCDVDNVDCDCVDWMMMMMAIKWWLDCFIQGIKTNTELVFDCNGMAEHIYQCGKCYQYSHHQGSTLAVVC